jgi:MFS family permease
LLIVSAALAAQTGLQAGSGFWYLGLTFAAMGFGMGLTMSPMTTAGMNAVDPSKAGVASGIITMSRMIGGTFGVAAIGALLSGVGGENPARFLHSMHEGLWLGAAVTTIGALLAWTLIDPRLPRRAPVAAPVPADRAA